MTNLEDTKWKCKSVIFDGEDFFINGLNIWNHKWEFTKNKITVKDPTYGKTFKADVFNIQFNQIKIEFAAVEFSNNVWGIYEKEPPR